ncbi:RidA family protein [Bradyrhizobium sp. RD5-C2]|uniref:RidA family protein n=1 Tax=Bradyrhizobium sp. RD5-C2 TaxID=244562 RepID=UPI001CC6A418|nr:RidA family protein [Bradyrhizobium sp. RD5-C2]
MSTSQENRPRFSPARRVSLGPSGDLLFLSGSLCVDEDARDNIELQTRRIFERIARVLGKYGASLSDIVKTTAFLADLADYDGFNRARVEIFMDAREPPASTAIGAGSLLGIGTRVEIEAVAFVPSR